MSEWLFQEKCIHMNSTGMIMSVVLYYKAEYILLCSTTQPTTHCLLTLCKLIVFCGGGGSKEQSVLYFQYK